ncbi:MAG: NAD(P)-binding domain-containing protein [Deltaproteobacteria bacterium]|nr:NAD(P)-binding domain-containing protein [Deltaproteobacteria bacterium]
MQIAIIGSGNIGGGLARAWRRAGHGVTFGARDPNEAELATLCTEIGAKAKSIADSVTGAEVVVLAMPFGALDSVLAATGDLAGIIVIDATNAVTRGTSGMTLEYGHTTSSGEQVQARIPRARVVRSFNAQGAENLANPTYGDVVASNFYCGDDAEAKHAVALLITDVGFEPIDAGPLASARLLEPLMLLWITCSRTVGTRDLGFKLLRR